MAGPGDGDRAYGSYVPATVVGEFVQYCVRFAIDEVADGAAQLKAESRAKVAVTDGVRSRILTHGTVEAMGSIHEREEVFVFPIERQVTGIIHSPTPFDRRNYRRQ